MAKEGSNGLKSGKGFYLYEGGTKGKPTSWATPVQVTSEGSDEPDASGLTLIQRRLIYPMINEAAKCLETVVPEAWAVDLAMVLGTGFAPFRGGPLHTADAIGIPQLVRGLEELSRTAGNRYEPCPLLVAMASDNRGFFSEQPTRPMAGVGAK